MNNMLRATRNVRARGYGFGAPPLISKAAAASVDYSFYLPFDGGVDQLPAAVEGASASLQYFGDDATNASWAAQAGGTLTAEGSNPTTLNFGSPLHAVGGANDDSVYINEQGAWADAGTSNGNVSTNDFYLGVYVFVTNTNTANACFCGKYDGTTGWKLFQPTANTATVRFLISDGTDSSSVDLACAANSWNFIQIAMDKNVGIRGAVNGQNDTNAVDTDIDDCDNSVKFAIGASKGTATDYADGCVALVELYQAAALWDGNTDNIDAALLERAYRLFGLYPDTADGTAMPSTSLVRTTAAWSWDYTDSVRRLYKVGIDHPCMCKQTDGSNEVKGIFVNAAAAQNKCTYSNDFTDASWVESGTVTTTANQAASPSGFVDGDQINMTAGTKEVEALACSNNQYQYFGIWLKSASGSTETCNLHIYENGNASTIDSQAAEVGTSWTFYLLSGKTAAADCTNIDYGITTSTCNVYASGAHLYQGNTYGAHIISEGSATTRALDGPLVFKFDDNNIGDDSTAGAMTHDFLTYDRNGAPIDAKLYLVDGVAYTAEAIRFRVNTANMQVQCFDAGGLTASIQINLDIHDGNKHTIKANWETDSFNAKIDSTEGTEDTSCGTPAAIDKLGFCESGSACYGLFGEVKVYPTKRDSFADI